MLGIGIWQGRRAAAAPLPKDADVVVVGAGAAGIAAARRVMAANRKVVVLEATDRVGGRCQTDLTTFGVPFDRGAHWMYLQDSNPVAKLARSVGIDVYTSPQNQRIRIGRRNARSGEVEDYLATLVRANRAIADAVRNRPDLAASEALPRDLGPWASTLGFVIGPAATGKDLKEVSALDLARAEPRDAGAFCRQGLGTLIAKLAEPVPVALSTPVTRLSWNGRTLDIETASGHLSPRAVIVTASTAVLASGDLKFTPDLPKRQLDAIAKLGLGSFDRIALELADNPLGMQHDDVVIEQSESDRTALLVANIGNTALCTVDVGGSFGRALTAQSDNTMVGFAVEWLTRLYGSDLRAALKRRAVTRWNAAPFVQGAMSAAAVGGQGARKVLMEPMNDVFFAGEAIHETLWGTVGGAWESGERAADAVLRRIGALKEPAPETPVRKRRRKGQTEANG